MIITKTPLRISFVGGGSDLPVYYRKRGGAVVSTAIDKFVYVIINHRFDGAIRIAYSKSETVDSVDDVEHDVIREALKLTGVTDSIEISYVGDIPIGRAGTGLGSSSALAVGILNALYAHKGKRVSPQKLAKDACIIEIKILKRPIGKQDQYVAAFGGLNHIQFHKNDRVSVTPLSMSKKTLKELDSNLLLFHTNLPTKSSTVLEEQKKKTLKNLPKLDSMVQMATTLANALRKNKLDTFGELLHENWLHKKQLASDISNETIDSYYEKALRAGALGGKIAGSGGGGFLLLYCPTARQNTVRKALLDLKEVLFSFEPTGSKVIYHV